MSPAVADVGPRGEVTRERLLETAVQLFAEHGFAKVTVRDICRGADANVAAVNYHFGDKFGLYMAVLRLAVDEMRKVSDVTMQPAPGSSAEDRLRHYIRMHVTMLVHIDPASWILRLMLHEMAEPTSAAPWIVEHGFRPRFRYLSGVLAELLGADESDPRVLRCAISVQSQFLFCKPDRFRAIAFGDAMPNSDAEIDTLVDHIAAFSLAGIRAIA